MLNNTERERRLLVVIDVFTLLLIICIIIGLFFVYLNPTALLDNIASPRLKTLLESMITNILPVCFVFILSYFLARFIQSIRADIQTEQLAAQLNTMVSQRHQTLNSAVRAGFIQCFENFDQIRMRERIGNATKVRILTTWVTDAIGYEDAFKKVMDKPNGEVQILMLNSEGEIAKQRSIDLGRNQDYVPNAIRQAKEELESINNRRNLNIQHKYYDTLPIAMLYMCDNDIFFTIFPHDIWSEKGPMQHIKITDDYDKEATLIGPFLSDQFNNIWRKAKELPKNIQTGG